MARTQVFAIYDPRNKAWLQTDQPFDDKLWNQDADCAHQFGTYEKAEEVLNSEENGDEPWLETWWDKLHEIPVLQIVKLHIWEKS